LAMASKLGTGFRLQGRAIYVTGATLMPPDLSQILRSHCAEIWDHLGGPRLDQPPRDLLTQLGTELIIPRTINEAKMALAEIAADSLAYTPRELQDRPELVGLDIETAILPGVEQRPSVKLKRDGYPAKGQPTFDSDAGLDPHRSRIRLVQLYGGGQRCLVLDTDLVPLDTVKEFLQCHTAVIHSAGFELHHFAVAGIEIPHFECTRQAAGLLLGTRRRSLADATSDYLGLDVSKEFQDSDWSAPYLSPGQLAYAAIDAILAFRLWLKLRLELIDKGRGDAYLLQRDVIRPTTGMIMRGIPVDREAHTRQVADWSVQQTKAAAEFFETTGQPFPEGKGKDKKKRAFLEEVLPKEMLETWPLTEKKHQLSTAAADLKRVSRDLPAIQALLDIEAMNKLLSTYGTELVNKISKVTGRVHASYNISAAKTGRFSSSHPNVQQLPTKKKAPNFRRCIAAPPGRVVIAGDFNMMELRAAAEVSNDAVMRTDFARGIDLHTQTAALMLGIAYDDVDDDARNRAKPVNFSIIYGAGTNGIVKAAWNNYGINLPWEEAETARQAFLSRYATYATWMGTHHAIATHRGIIEIGRLGRVIEATWETPSVTNGTLRRLPELDDDDDYWIADEADTNFFGSNYGWAQDRLKYTLCCNAPIQGACADASMLALLKVDAALREAGIDGGPILFVHDEIVVESLQKDAEQAEQILKICMEAGFIEIFPDAPRNKLVSTKIGANWGEAKP
jgi:DNA polymerase-1